jgi:sterol desaturase/sphingolipid hydroxylase (fatty acid hydroxylase superfamily)
MYGDVQEIKSWLSGLPLGWLIDYRFFLTLIVTLMLAGGYARAVAGHGLARHGPNASTRRDQVLLAWNFVYHCVTRALVAAGLWFSVRLLPPMALPMASWHPAIQAVVFILGLSLLEYGIHRAQHSIRAWWALHEYHHSSTTFGGIATFRCNLFELPLMDMVKLIPLALLGRAPLVYVVVSAIVLTNGFLIHSELNTAWGWFGRWILVSPNAHRMHHASGNRFHTVNFGSDLVIWDRLFGTYRAPPEDMDMPVGAATDYTGMGVFEGSVLGLRRAVAALTARDRRAAAADA